MKALLRVVSVFTEDGRYIKRIALKNLDLIKIVHTQQAASIPELGEMAAPVSPGSAMFSPFRH